MLLDHSCPKHLSRLYGSLSRNHQERKKLLWIRKWFTLYVFQKITRVVGKMFWKPIFNMNRERKTVQKYMRNTRNTNKIHILHHVEYIYVYLRVLKYKFMNLEHILCNTSQTTNFIHGERLYLTKQNSNILQK